jgi:thymidylate kinase
LRQTKHIFVEGINGSGKSTTAEFLTNYLTQHKIAARFLPEGGRGHPLRVATSLPHPFQIWRDITAEEFVRISLRKWESFVKAVWQCDELTICDGLLFHGNMMDLLLLNAEPKVVQRYIKDVISLLRDLRPVLIYLYQADVAQALRRIGGTRGDEWISVQVRWKLASPYGRKRGLQQMPAFNLPGFGGLIRLFTEFRSLSDAIVSELPIPVLQIDNTAGAWPDYYRKILNFLELPLNGAGLERINDGRLQRD